MGPVTYFSLCLLGCLIFNPSLAVPSLSARAKAVACPRRWLHFQGECYGYISEEKTWTEAEAECQQHGQGAHLVSIHSPGENDLLTFYIKRYHKKDTPVWIGLSDSKHNRCWKWSDHSLVSFKAWENGQPDNPCKKEHCVAFKYPEFKKWHDYPCKRRHAFVCKRGAFGKQVA